MTYRECPICGGPVTSPRSVTCGAWCGREYRRARYNLTHARTPDSAIHASHQHRDHGMTCVEFEALVRRSGRACELCLAPATVVGTVVRKTSLWIDHNHETGKVRGLVCPTCNAHMRRIDEGLRISDLETLHYLALEVPRA